MPIRLVAVDLDGTLIDHRLQMNPRDRQALRAAVAAGVQVVIATGRMFRSSLPYAQELGLSAEQGTQLAIATFTGAAQLAAQSTDPVSVLRERVTSKGGTTYAALTSMEASGVKEAIVQALHAAAQRGRELGEEFGKD